ncbi:hypothetical protein MRX96_003400 [Rhipicephalus microplus]
MAEKVSSKNTPPAYFLRNHQSHRRKYQGNRTSEYKNIQFKTSCSDSLRMPSAENMAVPHRELSRSSPDDLAIFYPKVRRVTRRPANFAVQSRQQEKSPILKFIQGEVESQGMSHEETASGK